MTDTVPTNTDHTGIDTGSINGVAIDTAAPAVATDAQAKMLLRRAMLDCDRYVIEMDYVDGKGQRTRRTVSPIRFVGQDRLLALCLCREEPRQFYLSRCHNVRLVSADDVLMPMPMSSPAVIAPIAMPMGFAGELMAC